MGISDARMELGVIAEHTVIYRGKESSGSAYSKIRRG